MTRVKICGITNLEDGQAAVSAGCDFLGFVFYPRSPRYVTPEQVKEMVVRLRKRSPNLRPASSVPGLRFVGVFVDWGPESVRQTLDFCDMDYAQLHGRESPETVAALKEQGYNVIKAFRIRDGTSLADLKRYQATAYLLDSYVPGQLGGTGHRFDWRLAVEAKAHGPILLAGGLTPDNVAKAVRMAQPWGVDVSSGVEAAPGSKDPEKLRRFIAATKAAALPPHGTT